MMQTEINLPYITADASGPRHLVTKLTRSRLEQLTSDLVDRTMAPLRQALSDANLNAGDIHEVVMVGGMTRMPAVQDRVRAFFGKDPHKGVNPDEVVAVGAAIQAGVLGGEVKDILLLDVTPFTLSIETLGGVATPQIERNTTIPTRRSQIFSTASDNQTQVEIHVFRVNDRWRQTINPSANSSWMASRLLPAEFRRSRSPSTSTPTESLHVTAKDKATGRSQHITITASSGLSDAEVEKMRQDAETHAEADRKRKELIEARNNADNTAYAAEKALKEFGDKVPADLKTEIETKVADLRAKAKTEDAAAMKSATEELGQVIQKIGAAVYQAEPQAEATSGEPGQGEQSNPGPDVVDGEVKE